MTRKMCFWRQWIAISHDRYFGAGEMPSIRSFCFFYRVLIKFLRNLGKRSAGIFEIGGDGVCYISLRQNLRISMLVTSQSAMRVKNLLCNHIRIIAKFVSSQEACIYNEFILKQSRFRCSQFCCKSQVIFKFSGLCYCNNI